MQVTGVDHVTIRVQPERVEALRVFYEDVLGLRTGARPLKFPGVWLYVGEQAVVHVAGNLGEDEAAAQGGAFDHVAFRTRGLSEAKSRLDAAGIAWREVWRPEMGILQLVLHDPAGVKVELAFDPAEHQG
jgi:catechol 2,3-dioxygenase-like lactoylglutathione lyase family enzyme